MNLNSVTDMIPHVAKQTEIKMLSHLNELTKRGLLVVEYGEYHLFRNEFTNEISCNQTITIKLKDQEYIERLEEEIETLKKLIGSRKK